MPYYDVKCNECNELYENLKLTYKEFDDHKCPKCGGKTSRYWGGDNLIGSVLKGGGWYKDGYSKPASKINATSKTSD